MPRFAMLQYVDEIVGWTVDGKFRCFKCMRRSPKRAPHREKPENCVGCGGRGGVIPLTAPKTVIDPLFLKHLIAR